MATDMSMTVTQAALYAGVSAKTIRRWIGAGRLTTGRAGLVHVIDRQALEQAMASPMDVHTVPRLAPGHGPVQSIVQELLDRLERQSQRIGELEAQVEHLKALPAPSEPQETALAGAPRNGTPQDTTRAWWRFWSR